MPGSARLGAGPGNGHGTRHTRTGFWFPRAKEIPLPAPTCHLWSSQYWHPILQRKRALGTGAGRRATGLGSGAQEAPRSPVARPEPGRAGDGTDGSQACPESALCTSPVLLSQHPPGLLLGGQDSPQAGPSAWVSRPYQRALEAENQGLVWLSHHLWGQLTNGLRLSLPGCKTHRKEGIQG